MEALHVNEIMPAGDTRERVKAVLDGREASQAEVAREAGVSASAVNRWLNGKYEGDNAAVEAKLTRWLDERDRQTGFLLPDAPEWVATPTGERILAALAYGQMAADLVVVYGGAGLGKTRAVRQYAATRPNVWVATLSPATATPSACLEEIMEALGMREGPGGGAARMQRALILRLRDTKGLLVLDESQHLAVAALETVRAIHDATEIGLALVGNERVYSRLAASGQSALFAQLFSRVGKRLHLSVPKREDVEALMTAWGLGDRETLAYLWAIARTPGALRGAVKSIRLGTMLARGAGEGLELRHVKAAWRELDASNGHAQKPVPMVSGHGNGIDKGATP
jgi:hypothetical protein